MTRAQIIQLINVGRAKLGWDEDTYRAVLARFGGVPDEAGRVSLNSLSPDGMNALLAHMRNSGFVPQARKAPHNLHAATRAELTKIEAYLADAGQPWQYAQNLARRMCKGKRIEWCSKAELASIIAALDADARKRLSAVLQDTFGPQWQDIATGIAALLWNFDGARRDITAYAQTMSHVLRWWRGELEAACVWPPDADKPWQCCSACQLRALARQGTAA